MILCISLHCGLPITYDYFLDLSSSTPALNIACITCIIVFNSITNISFLIRVYSHSYLEVPAWLLIISSRSDSLYCIFKYFQNDLNIYTMLNLRYIECNYFLTQISPCRAREYHDLNSIAGTSKLLSKIMPLTDAVGISFKMPRTAATKKQPYQNLHVLRHHLGFESVEKLREWMGNEDLFAGHFDEL